MPKNKELTRADENYSELSSEETAAIYRVMKVKGALDLPDFSVWWRLFENEHDERSGLISDLEIVRDMSSPLSESAQAILDLIAQQEPSDK